MSNKQFSYTFILIFVFTLIVILTSPLILYPDSDGYLDMSIIRSPSYPLFLSLLKLVFGSAETIITIIIQSLLGFYAIHYLIRQFRSHFSISNLWYVILTILLLAPYIYNHKLANSIMSEALAYPLYLIVVAKFTDALVIKKFKRIYFTLLLLAILILTRSQFLYLVPIGVLIAIYIAYTKSSYTTLAKSAIIFLILPILTSILDKSYHKIKHGHYASTPWTGIVLISGPMYVSDSKDINLFTEDKERDIFQKAHEKLTNQCLNINCLKNKEDTNIILTYTDSYSEIANRTILPIASTILNNGLTREETFIEVDRVTKNMYFPLLLDNFKEWFKLYLKNIKMGYGNSIYMLLTLILMIYSLWLAIKHKSKSGLVMGFLLSLILANIAIVAIGIHTINRFTFYNNWIIFMVIFVLLPNFKHTHHQELNKTS